MEPSLPKKRTTPSTGPAAKRAKPNPPAPPFSLLGSLTSELQTAVLCHCDAASLSRIELVPAPPAR